MLHFAHLQSGVSTENTCVASETIDAQFKNGKTVKIQNVILKDFIKFPNFILF